MGFSKAPNFSRFDFKKILDFMAFADFSDLILNRWLLKTNLHMIVSGNQTLKV